MRDFAQIKLSVWNDDDFRALSPSAQYLYFMLLSHPTLNYAGVGQWYPGRFASMCKGWSKDGVIQAASELVETTFIVIDQDSDEYLIRSFVRNDPLMRRGNMGVAMARAFSTVASAGIRGVIVSELHRLRVEQPDLAGFKSDEVETVLSKISVDVHDFPCGHLAVKPQVLLLDGSHSDHLTDHYGDHHTEQVSTMQSTKVIDKVSTKVFGEVIGKVIDTTATATTTFNEGGKGSSNQLGERVAQVTLPPPIDDQAGLDAAVDAALAGVLQAPVTADPGQGHVGFAAYGTLDDPRCAKHKDLPRDQVPACRDCAQARQVLQERHDHEKQEARQLIDECPWCDERGIANLHDRLGRPVAVKCDHIHQPVPPPAPEVFKPLRTKNAQNTPKTPPSVPTDPRKAPDWYE